MDMSQSTSSSPLLGTSLNESDPEEDTWDESHGKVFYNSPFLTYPMCILLGVGMTVAILGNVMVLVTIARHRGMRTRTNLFLANLAVADIMVAVLDMPLAIATFSRGRWWPFSRALCMFNGFTIGLGLHTSTHTLMLISVHKYVSITRPFSRAMTPARILLMIAAAWIWSAIYNLAPIYGWTRTVYKYGASQCGPAIPNTTLQQTHSLVNTLVNVAIPFVVMCFCYYRIFQEVRQHMSRMRETSNLDLKMSVTVVQQKRIAETLVIVLVCFVTCWATYLVYSCTLMAKGEGAVPAILNPISYWFGYLNSACNPIIYAFRSPSFRQGYLEIICSRPKGALYGGLPASRRSSVWQQGNTPDDTLQETDSLTESSRSFRRFNRFLPSALRRSVSGGAMLATRVVGVQASVHTSPSQTPVHTPVDTPMHTPSFTHSTRRETVELPLGSRNGIQEVEATMTGRPKRLRWQASVDHIRRPKPLLRGKPEKDKRQDRGQRKTPDGGKPPS